jgi:hypothetical protein
MMKNICSVLVGLLVFCQVSCSPEPKPAPAPKVKPTPATMPKPAPIAIPKPAPVAKVAAPRPKSDISGMTLAETMRFARNKAKAGQYDYIIDNLLSKECKADMARKHGADKWRDKCRENLKTLPFYFDWMKKHSVRVFGDKIIVTGQHACHAEYVKVGDSYMIVNFGQQVSSM